MIEENDIKAYKIQDDDLDGVELLTGLLSVKIEGEEVAVYASTSMGYIAWVWVDYHWKCLWWDFECEESEVIKEIECIYLRGFFQVAKRHVFSSV